MLQRPSNMTRQQHTHRLSDSISPRVQCSVLAKTRLHFWGDQSSWLKGVSSTASFMYAVSGKNTLYP